MDFLFVTGMSGAGKTVAVNELEDMGYFCVDNIPSGLIGAFARLCEQSPVGGRIALVTDFRSGEQFAASRRRWISSPPRDIPTVS